MPASSTDRIEKSIFLRASRARVFRALTDAREFGAWFGVAFVGAFKPGQPLRGKITNKGYDHLTLEILVDRIEAGRTFSFRWHPYAIDATVDYSKEPMTLVTFMLEDAPGGTRLTVVESGFDGIPAARRADAFRMNEQGWAAQMSNIERHVGATA
jgi:uncharacterized protein YndB with AHSA1/START domain